MKIAIIGAGFTGLTAAYELSKAGHKVTVFEKNSYVGGLSAGIKKGFTLSKPERERGRVEGWNLECFQHHFFANDTEAFKLIGELGLSDKLLKLSPKTSILYQDEIYHFDTPLSLFTFPHLSIFEKAKLGSAIAYLKLTNDWKKLESETADSWWKGRIGDRVYSILWEPLLGGKFGDYYKDINMAWFWARIKKRTQKLYYLKGSLQMLIDKLVGEIQMRDGEVRLNVEAKGIKSQMLNLKSQSYILNVKTEKGNTDDKHFFDRVIVTTPPQTLLKLLPDLPTDYKEKIKKLRGIGAQALILFLDKQFLTDGTYWLNINDSSYPFLSVVEHTNFIDPKYYGGNHIVYIGNYLPMGHPFMQMTKEELLEEFGGHLSRINQQFNPEADASRRYGASNLTIKQSFLFREEFAQPITPINHSQNIPSLQVPMSNVYFASMSQVYPWDRGVNYAIELGRRVAREI